MRLRDVTIGGHEVQPDMQGLESANDWRPDQLRPDQLRPDQLRPDQLANARPADDGVDTWPVDRIGRLAAAPRKRAPKEVRREASWDSRRRQ
jgi:hypothetical protein